ncbi:hypothetical protein [Helicobacter macacae]|uniref:Uncharacterized protein n=1 Tax=Helicobacter macacae MIT 99-5501 TaxID=1357400 RepID=V8CCZ2_9HELI|nr:hypothetical protein [Helicobacter macacae]ETD24947.1 hypothetical protein HMPREF2086_00281 [Helicobacter macacae MIT 99-5501]
MARELNEKDIQEFYDSLSADELIKVKEVDELWANFLDEKQAKEAFEKWDSDGCPRGYTIEEAINKIKAARCN